MTKYDKSIIYKICCKDLLIQDIYIGSTLNFRNRKWKHKSACNNINRKEYNSYKYKFIRNNGGWENWDMIQLKEVSCNSKRELEAEERKAYEELKPSLNTIKPFITKEENILRLTEWRKQNPEEYIRKTKIQNDKKKNKKYTCDCGSTLLIYGKEKHERSKKHKKYLDTL